MANDAARLGCYVLPGGVADPTTVINEARAAEDLGLGAVWIGERFDTKDLPSLAGALSQTTTRIRIGAAITPVGLRHPMVLASMGQTLQALTHGRFALGFGRSASWRWQAYGVTAPTLASMRDGAEILRRLWAGETVDYNGPAGRFPRLRLPQRPTVEPPSILLAAVGPRTLRLAGETFDGVILHPFLTPAAVQRSTDVVREAAAASGRRMRCVATVVVADEDRVDADLAVRARAAGYFHVAGLGDALVAANQWDADDLTRYRAHPTLVALGDQQADKALSRTELASIARTMPEEWLPSASATGNADSCARRIREYLDAGADEIIIHGSTAPSIGAVVEALTGIAR